MCYCKMIGYAVLVLTLLIVYSGSINPAYLNHEWKVVSRLVLQFA